MPKFGDLGPDQISEILSYLMSKELMRIRQVDKQLLGGHATSVVVKTRIRSDFGVDVNCESKACSPIGLYELEIKSLLLALRSPHGAQSSSSRGFWISTQWINVAQTYYHNIYSKILELKDANMKKKRKFTNNGSKKQGPVERPSLSINSEITCPHGHLSADKTGSRAQRRIISQYYWNIIKAYHNPLESDLDALNLSECKQCSESKSQLLIQSMQAREILKTSRVEKVSPGLLSLLNRKNGIPWRMKPNALSVDDSSPSSGDSINSGHSSYSAEEEFSMSALSIKDDPGSGLGRGCDLEALGGGGVPLSLFHYHRRHHHHHHRHYLLRWHHQVTTVTQVLIIKKSQIQTQIIMTLKILYPQVFTL